MNRDSQRVRIGLTGLAFVFLLVLVATVFTRPSNEEPITAERIDALVNGSEQALPEANVTEPNEPLAELGVAPGGTAEGNAQDARPVEDPLKARRR